MSGTPSKSFHPVSRFAPWLFVGPAILLSTFTLLLPFAYAIMLSFRGIKVRGGGLGLRQEVNVGFANYIAAATNPELWAGFGRMLRVGMVSVPITLGLALLFALLLDTPRLRLARFSRLAIFVPYAVPGVIASLMWGFIYLPGVSPIREVFEALGLAPPDFFGETSVFYSIANISIWGAVGFNMVILYTALRGISPELYDAARVDGCSEFQIAIHVKLPLLLPALLLTGLFSLVGTIQLFSEPKTLEPLGNAISTTWVPVMLVYRDAFIAQNLYSGAATAMFIAAMTTGLSLVLMRVVQRRAQAGRET
jgi:multiple sugar transport system permease protein